MARKVKGEKKPVIFEELEGSEFADARHGAHARGKGKDPYELPNDLSISSPYSASQLEDVLDDDA